MSVVHEALKRAGGGTSKEKERPALTVKSPGKQPAWFFWTMLIFVFAEAALCWREHALRLHSEEKMREAYLQLNDARGKDLDKDGTVKRAMNESLDLRLKLTEVETENLKKEKKISDLTRRLHESEMEKIKLSEFSTK